MVRFHSPAPIITTSNRINVAVSFMVFKNRLVLRPGAKKPKRFKDAQRCFTMLQCGAVCICQPAAKCVASGGSGCRSCDAKKTTTRDGGNHPRLLFSSDRCKEVGFANSGSSALMVPGYRPRSFYQSIVHRKPEKPHEQPNNAHHYDSPKLKRSEMRLKSLCCLDQC